MCGSHRADPTATAVSPLLVRPNGGAQSGVENFLVGRGSGVQSSAPRCKLEVLNPRTHPCRGGMIFEQRKTIMANETSSPKLHYILKLSADRDKFFRRTCPSCGRDYKTEAKGASHDSPLSTRLRRFEPRRNRSVQDEDHNEYLYCPYCRCRSSASETHTEETVALMRIHAQREVSLPRLNDLFSTTAEMFSRLNRPGSAIKIKSDFSRLTMPPQPVHGPEPPDMKIVHLQCCSKRVKVAEYWHDLRVCPYCGTSVTLV